eukprot:SAG31_NODE_3691_length_3985_cov_3.675244_7_plen_113_part_01
MLHTQVQDIPRCTALCSVTKKRCATGDGLNAAVSILHRTHLVRSTELPPKARSATVVLGIRRGTGRGGRAGLLRTQLYWSLSTGARGRPGVAGAAAAARRATRGGGGAVDVSD